MFALVIILKISFLSSLAIFFYLDAVYWASGASTFLINTLNSLIKKQMFNEVATLACSGYFPSHPQPGLIGAREAKVAEVNWAVGFI